MRTLEQRRAAFAYLRLERLEEKYKIASDTEADGAREMSRVASHLHRLPAMVLTNGLGQTLAFLLSKADADGLKAESAVFDIVAEWLIDSRGIYQGKKRAIVNSIMEGDRHTYRRATEEVLALLAWLKHFAKKYEAPNPIVREQNPA